MFHIFEVDIPLIKDFELLTNFKDLGFKVLLPILLVLIIAGFIGFERQNIGKAAGVSSHVLVALAATGIAIIYRLMFDYQLGLSFSGIESRPEGQRLIAQVIAGVGFIGAGVILKDSQQIIRGITTASTIWAVAIMGLILGSGYIFIGSILGLSMALFMTLRNVKRGINPFVRQHDPHEADDHHDDA